MARIKNIRVGKVTLYLRGTVWYLRYYEHGQRHQVRAGPEVDAARRLAAELNVQLESGAPVATSFEPITIDDLRQRWLEYHEHVRRSSMASINRYRTAAEHLLRFVRNAQPLWQAGQFRDRHAEAFARYLREVKVAPNGHKNATQRCLRDKGIKYVLAVCRSLFHFALKRRHLPPYAENPFASLQIERIPIEDAKPVILLTFQQEQILLEACDAWQFPIFLTLALTGLRPGELTHLMVEDLDLKDGWLAVRNKPELGWQVKTRNERKVPLVPELVQILQSLVGARTGGPVFLRRRFVSGSPPPRAGLLVQQLATEIATRAQAQETLTGKGWTRQEKARECKHLWVELGAIREDRIRAQFVHLTKQIGCPTLTAPKVFRHMFATALQDANVDPLIRNQLMGHAPAEGMTKAAGGLAMTGVYTHSRPETVRHQLLQALAPRPALAVARERLRLQLNNVSCQS